MIPATDQHLPPKQEEDTIPLPHRAFPRRSLLGITAIGAAALLTGCGGGDDESDDEDTSDSPSGTDLDNAASTIPDENQQVGEDDEPEEADD